MTVRRLGAAGLAALSVAGLVLIVSGISPHPAIAVDAPPLDMQAALAADGFDLQAAPAGLGGSAISPETAVTTAIASFSAPRPAVVYSGLLTVYGSHIGDETTPLAINQRGVYAIALEGLRLMPLGKPGDQPAVSAEHTELVVFVDASSGQILVATTVR